MSSSLFQTVSGSVQGPEEVFCHFCYKGGCSQHSLDAFLTSSLLTHPFLHIVFFFVRAFNVLIIVVLNSLMSDSSAIYVIVETVSEGHMVFSGCEFKNNLLTCFATFC